MLLGKTTSQTVKVLDNKMTSTSPGPTWKCCVNSSTLNLLLHPAVPQSGREGYRCPQNPANLSFYYDDRTAQHPLAPLRPALWKDKSIFFVGGSTTRQMVEQVYWELASSLPESGPSRPSWGYSYETRFVFKLTRGQTGCCNYDASHTIDLRKLDPDIEKQLLMRTPKALDYMIINVGSWWDCNAIGTVVDEHGIEWKVDTNHGKEWNVIGLKNASLDITDSTIPSPPLVSFASLMERALTMMNRKKSPQTTLIWRSETKTDCPIGTKSFRTTTVIPVLKATSVPVLNISLATCQYASQNLDGSSKIGPHLCFPSPVLRYWLQVFQEKFLL